jgi:hypothetical protein
MPRQPLCPITLGGISQKVAEAFLLPPTFLKKRKKRRLQPVLGDDAVKEGSDLSTSLLDQHSSRVIQFLVKHAAVR